jgi:tRNA-Thr(GGU) m(6)t(6)A37 methyltransferase TsaA
MEPEIIKPIGMVRSEVKDRKLMAPFGAPARVELFPEYEPGLHHLEKHSHLWVIAWLHEAERDRLRVTPRGVSIQDETALHGVFAVRSPTRPNPLALTAAKIERIEGNVIWVDQLDFIEGTPVIDLKPYFRSRDAIHSARNAPIGQPDSRQAMLVSILGQAERFHGERCGGLALAARIIEHLRSVYLDYAEICGFSVTLPEGSGCLIDCIIGLSVASFGEKTLNFHRQKTIQFSGQKKCYEYQLLEPGRQWGTWGDLTWEGVLALEDAELYSVI